MIPIQPDRCKRTHDLRPLAGEASSLDDKDVPKTVVLTAATMATARMVVTATVAVMIVIVMTIVILATTMVMSSRLDLMLTATPALWPRPSWLR